MKLVLSQAEKLIADADENTLCEWFAGMSELERKALAVVAIKSYNSLLADGGKTRGPLNVLLVSASEKQLKKLSFPWIRRGDLYMELLEQEKPAALQGWLDAGVARLENGLLDDLVAAGLCNLPDTDEYVLALLAEIRIQTLHCPLAAHLKEYPEFIKHYVWRLFEIEGGDHNSLAFYDKWSPSMESFQEASLELSKQGVLSRERLLDCCLAALQRDFNKTRSSWFVDFHKCLDPSPGERRVRAASYASLLASSVPSTVDFALDVLKSLAEDEALPSELLLRTLGNVMSARRKSCVEAALTILKMTMKSDPSAAVGLCSVTAVAFFHDSPEIQNKAARLIIEFFPKNHALVECELERYRECMAPSARQKLIPWMKREISHQDESLSSPIVLASQVYVEEPPKVDDALAKASRLDSYETIDDVIAGCSYFFDNPGDVVRLELVIEGIIRFCARQTEDIERRASSLKAKALSISDDGPFLQRQMASFVLCWLTGNPLLTYRNVLQAASHEYMYKRMAHLLERVIKRNSLPVLSALTHDSGWIDPVVVAKRWQNFADAGVEPDDYDQTTCFLRLPLAHLERLLPEYIALSGNFWDAVRFAMGYSPLPGEEGANSLLWQAAKHYRNDTFSFFSLAGGGILYQFDSDLEFLRSLGLYFSTMQNRFVASGIRSAGIAIDELVFVGTRRYIEALLKPTFIFDQPAYHLLAASLINFDPECASLARDVVINLIDRRLLSAEKLGREIGIFLYCGRSKTKRLVHGLTDIARVSGCHSSAIRQVLERALQGGEIVPRDIFSVLELLKELLHAEGITLTNSATREYLQGVQLKGKAGKIIRELLSN